MATPTTTEPAGTSRGAWMALIAALLGWMFDGAEMGVFSMVGGPALADLLPDGAKNPHYDLWFGIVTAGFLVGAATGGVLFGWLGDRIGRVRAMTLSVLFYALFTGLCGLSQSAWMLWSFRFIAALGMGGEWALGVALVMEVWPNRSRAFMAGLIGAAANVGYGLVGFIGLGLNTFLADLQTSWLPALGLSDDMVQWLTRNQGWRIMMMLGTTPALLTFFIRLFVPESEKWEHEQQAGSTNRMATKDLVGVLVGSAGPALIVYVWAQEHVWSVRIVCTLIGLVVATAGYTYPVVQFLKRQAAADPRPENAWQPVFRRMMLGAGLAGVALLGTWGAAQWAPKWAYDLTKHSPELQAAAHPKEMTQIWSAFGAIVGTIAAAMAGDWLGRRAAYALLCILSFGSILLFYQGNDAYGSFFLPSVFLVGVCTASFYGWLPLYLPELFRTNVRATGQGFAFNFGRIIAAVGALQVGNLFPPGEHATRHLANACSIMSVIYVAGLVLIWFAPETKGKQLPE